MELTYCRHYGYTHTCQRNTQHTECENIMFEYLLIAGLVTALFVAAIIYINNIKIIPMLLVGVIVAFGLNPLVYNVGENIAQTSASKFNEYWNGFETASNLSEITCTRDGSCRNTYQCDPYQVTVTRTRTVTDSEGKSRTETYQEQETRYHDCPYSQQETSYYVDSTIDNFTIASSVMTGEPFRMMKSIPGGKQTAPAEWLEAKARIDSGNPGPVTAVKSYQNYILASQSSLFKTYSDKIEDLKSKNLLPIPSNGTFKTYQATKAYKVGTANVPLFGNYLTDLSYLNGAIGDDLRGDLHVVFAPENIDYGKDDYANALMAYWQSPEMKRNAISKNSIVIIMGTSSDGKTVSWAKAMTGMPLGNEAMLTQLESELKDAPLDAKLLGKPTFDVTSNSVKSSDGLVESILWGTNKFARVSMTANGSDDNGSGFAYLKDQIKPSGWAIFWIAFVNSIMGISILGLVMLLIRGEQIPASWTGFSNSKKRF